MTEKIKIALLHWARKVIDQSAGWDDEKTHDAIQNLYELSIVQKMLLEQETPRPKLVEAPTGTTFNEVIESLTGKPKTESSKEENMEVAPMMETIKNMVTEMPEPETFEKLFETVEETPTFVPKVKEPVAEPLKKKNVPTEIAKTSMIILPKH